MLYRRQLFTKPRDQPKTTRYYEFKEAPTESSTLLIFSVS